MNMKQTVEQVRYCYLYENLQAEGSELNVGLEEANPLGT